MSPLLLIWPSSAAAGVHVHANVHEEMRAAVRHDASEASLAGQRPQGRSFLEAASPQPRGDGPELAASSDGTVLGIAAAKEREPTAIVPKMHVFTCTLPCSALSDSRPREDAIGVSE
jgi:hypothetical protein